MISTSEIVIFYKFLILPHFGHCSIYCGTISLKNKAPKITNRVVHILLLEKNSLSVCLSVSLLFDDRLANIVDIPYTFINDIPTKRV